MNYKRLTTAGTIAACCLLTIGYDTVATAQKVQRQPEVFKKLLDCRAIIETAARLSCYDEQVKAISMASDKQEVVILDKEEIQNTRRSLFGFSFPKLPFFKGDDTHSEEDKQLDDQITGTRALGYGVWQITLKEGSVWQTIEPMPYGSPRVGLNIHIVRAALGSYKASINKWPTVKIKRVS